MLNFIPTLVALVLCTSHLAAFEDWPQWRGPNRDGISQETGLIHDFSDGSRILWNHSFGGGFSGISVVGNYLYTMQSENAEYAVCLISGTGRTKWSVRTGPILRDAQGGDGPRATPTVSGDRVFVLGAMGRFMALDRFTGDVLWRKDLIRDLDGSLPNWGFCNSPLVVDDLVLIATGSRAQGSLVALRVSDGTVVWRTSTSGAGYASPIRVVHQDKPQAVFFTEQGLESVEPKTGNKIWQYEWQTPLAANSATPVWVAPDKILISSGYGMGSAMVQLPGRGSAPREVWKTKTLTSSVSTPLFYGGNLYGFHDQVFECLDLDGRVRWEQRGLGMGTVLGADGKLYILGENGRLVVARASRQRFQQLSSSRLLKGRCWTAPSLANGVLYLRNERHIMALNLKRPTQTDGG